MTNIHPLMACSRSDNFPLIFLRPPKVHAIAPSTNELHEVCTSYPSCSAGRVRTPQPDEHSGM